MTKLTIKEVLANQIEDVYKSREQGAVKRDMVGISNTLWDIITELSNNGLITDTECNELDSLMTEKIDPLY